MQFFLDKYNISLTQEEINKFEKLLNIFIEKNSQINLSAIREKDQIIEKHFIDSILLYNYYKLDGKILDLGTGGGFPGLPLKIIDKNNSSFTLLDSIGKKLKIVDYFIKELSLENISTIHARAEELAHKKEHRETYDFVVSRATAYLPTLLEYTIPFLKIGGIFISYKLDNPEEIVSSQKVLDTLNREIVKEVKYNIGGQDRIYLLIQKVGPTPKKYPRSAGEPLKNPII